MAECLINCPICYGENTFICDFTGEFMCYDCEKRSRNYFIRGRIKQLIPPIYWELGN